MFSCETPFGDMGTFPLEIEPFCNDIPNLEYNLLNSNNHMDGILSLHYRLNASGYFPVKIPHRNLFDGHRIKKNFLSFPSA